MDKKIYNCPNCGAPITDEKCPYCGTVIYDFACLDMDHPTYLKIKHDKRIIMVKAFFTSSEMRFEFDSNIEVNLNFVVLADEEGHLFKVVDI